jgi:hypothetical protein
MYEAYLIMRALVVCVGIPMLILWLLVVRENKQNSQPRRVTKLPHKRTYSLRKKAGSITIGIYDKKGRKV